MKKFMLLLLFVAVFLLPSSKKVYADDLSSVMDQYALTGKELDEFEKNERNVSRSSRSSVPQKTETELKEQYASLLESGYLGSDVTFEMYRELATATPPIDPVVSNARSVAGNPQPGDIMITNGTSFGGLTGHAGIFLNNGTILSIQGGGYTPAAMSIIDWAKKYMSKKGQWTKIYRPAAKYKPNAAYQWAINNYRGKNYSYGINTNIWSKNPTYCSKIVWQAYWYSSAAAQVGGMKQPLIVSPYDLPAYFNSRPAHVGTWSA
ncbi:hypothetical protein [Enterococcus caccae]|uniref:NlpC/P60 domain-containing protein n=1 Tax=Enterococcus caccae ATCC BAA-1240 TaxID=1158612 RepID=R3WSJ1_9ENTE|nr:hypothetical protein [Enterococcus caccae]EOL50367.1 hypothetical protein UC7_00360 [Enterococcus caccae ATCC BAA-1240]EOT59196.1 hypothetical protein I580_02228 [Enterococcus caccae ATCC BAA-1240]OJG25728.1 hypothetical protein RU98_GL000969 [Enterococcus caccae]